MKTLIIAPHIDDEMIGCWSVLQDRARDITVCFGYELTEERQAEAQKLTQFGFRLLFGYNEMPEFWSFKEVYVPSRRDWHTDHKVTNAKFRHAATHFYSVDMEGGKYIGDANSVAKRRLLDEIYPSQASLWATDAKYYLFEDIRRKDYNVQTIIRLGELTIEVPEHAAEAVRSLLRVYPSNHFKAENLFNKILEAVPVGKVRVSTLHTAYET